MKVQTIKRIQEVILMDHTYKCDYCNTKSESKLDIERCERLCLQKRCKHNKKEHKLLTDIDGRILAIDKYCFDCRLTLEKIEFPETFNSVQLKVFFDCLKNYRIFNKCILNRNGYMEEK